MSDNTATKHDRWDGSKINMDQDDEVEYWTKRFGVSREQLQALVSAVGPAANEVERRLKWVRSSVV